MFTLKLVRQYCSKFPHITQKEFSKIQEEILTLLTKIRRIETIPERYKTDEEKALVHEKYLLTSLTKLKISDEYFSIFDLLNSQELIGARESHLTQSFLWGYFIETYLLLNDHNSCIIYLRDCVSQFIEPPAFMGLILALVHQKFDHELIIQSGILHYYFQFHIYQEETITKTFQDLEILAQTNTELKEFLHKINKIHCGLATLFPNKNLTGQLVTTPLIHSTEALPTPASILIENDEKLIQLLQLQGIHFLKSMFFKLKFSNHSKVTEAWVSSLTPAQINKLFIDIKQNIDGKLQIKLLNKLSNYISKETSLKLLKHHKPHFWMILASCPQAYKYFLKRDLHEICLEQPIQKEDIIYIIHLLEKNKYFHKINNGLYEKIFNLYLNQNELELDHFVLKNLKKHIKQTRWLQQKIDAISLKLFHCIQNNLDHFTNDEYTNIRDLFFTQLKQIEKLKELGLRKFTYPTSCYELTSKILTTLYIRHHVKDILNWIDHMIPIQYKNTPHNEEYINSQQRLLKEWLSYTNEPEIIFAICMTLFQNKAFDKTSISSILAKKEFNLIQFAFTKPSYLEQYVQTLSEDECFKWLTKPVNRHSPKFIDQILKYPKFLTVILKNLSIKNKIKLCTMKDKSNIPYFFSMMAHQELITLMFKDNEESLALIKLCDENQNNVFFLGLEQPALLTNLLLSFPRDLLSEVLNSKNAKEETYLELLLSKPKLYQLVISHLPKDGLADFLSESHSQSSFYMKLIMSNSDLFKLTCSNLHSAKIYQLIQAHQDFIIPILLNTPKVLVYILKTLEPEHLKLLAQKYTELNKHIIEHMKYLKPLLDSARLTIFNTQTTLSQQFSMFTPDPLAEESKEPIRYQKM